MLNELVIKGIGQYLLKTKDKGLILLPKFDFCLDMIVDADFFSLWHQEFSQPWDFALPQTRDIIAYCGCPIQWASKLQTEMALGTPESEYIALSMANSQASTITVLSHCAPQNSLSLINRIIAW
jgi:hypothetical protein